MEGWTYLGKCGHCGVAGYYNEQQERTVWNHRADCCMHEIPQTYERGDFLEKWRDLHRDFINIKGRESRHEFLDFTIGCLGMFMDEILTDREAGSMLADAYERFIQVLEQEANRKSDEEKDEKNP